MMRCRLILRGLSSDCLLNKNKSFLTEGSQVKIPPHIEIKELSKILHTSVKELTRAFCKKGNKSSKKSFTYIRDLDGVRYEYTAPTAAVIPYRLAAAYANRIGYVTEEIIIDPEEILDDMEDKSELENHYIRKLPIVSVMGHIDHGKTTLLDVLTGSKVASTEPGFITQDVRAVTTTLNESCNPFTFLDTPGHFHFDRMRENSAVVADCVLLVVAADEGLLAQSYDVIQWAKEMNLNLLVALNKIDICTFEKISFVKQQLLSAGIGDETKIIEISAIHQINLPELKSELVNMTNKVNKLADGRAPPEAIVLESLYKSGAGIILRSLIQCGKLKVGQYFVCGFVSGRVRSLRNCKGESIYEALPGSLVEVLGGKKSKVDSSIEPPLGDTLFAVSRERAYEIMQARLLERRFENARLIDDSSSSNNTLQPLTKEEEREFLHQLKNPHLLSPNDQGDDGENELKLIIKSNTAGSLDVLRNYLYDIPGINIIHSSIGDLTMSDIDTSITSNYCPIICYRVNPSSSLKKSAQNKKVKIFYDNVLHRLIDLAREEAGLNKPFIDVKPIQEKGKRFVYSL